MLCFLSNFPLIIPYVVFSDSRNQRVQYIVLSKKETDEDEAVAILNQILETNTFSLETNTLVC